METKTTTAVATTTTEKQKGECEYLVAGQPVKLSYQIIRDFLTRGGGTVTDQDLTQFISICKYNELNPFLNEAYLVKFGTSPAQMVVSKEAYMKRADACQNYEGIQAGVIVIRDGVQVELEGCFFMPEDKLAGGWAKVYRSDRKFPVIARVTLSEYDKKQSVWLEKKSTMISKVAKVQALREAFPAQLGAMYTQEESNVSDAQFEDVTKKANKITIKIDGDDKPTGPEQTVSETTQDDPKKADEKRLPGFE